MLDAMSDCGISGPEQQVLRDYFSQTAKTLTDPFIPFYQMPLDQLRQRLESELLQESDGRSLLRDAVSNWDLPRVRLLLDLGANPNASGAGEHGPLYRVANAGSPRCEADGLAIVELLIARGADVDWPSGPGRCTPLHMAARRGHVALARSLIKAGANLESRDSKGETPLRRAVNCSRQEMASLLVSEGADPLSKDKAGKTPLDAARKREIRQVLMDRIGANL
jgi:ankyrin repeat protein